jgi:hypothetical protein
LSDQGARQDRHSGGIRSAASQHLCSEALGFSELAHPQREGASVESLGSK